MAKKRPAEPPADPSFHPAADLLPMLSEKELRELAADIKANGLLEDIWLFGGSILDGRNRFLACKRAGVTPRFREYEGDASPVDFVLSLNLWRRHLTEYQKRKLIAEVLRNDPSRSDREIGRRTKTDGKTVRDVRRGLEGRAEIPHVATRADAIGRQQPATKPPKPIKVPKNAGDAWEPGCDDADEPAGPAFAKDAAGEPIPQDLRDAFGDPFLRDGATWARSIAQPAGRLKAQIVGKSEHFPFLKAGDASERLQALQEEAAALAADFESGLPKYLCPSCHGKKCKDCRRAGLVPAWRYRELTQ